MQKILLVEDSKLTQQMVLQALRANFEIIVAENSSEALHLSRYHRPDLILMDIHLENETGYNIFETLKKEGLVESVPVIFLTGEESIQSKVIAFNLGADDYLTKPFDPLELNLRIKARLKNPVVTDSSEIKYLRISVDLNSFNAYIQDTSDKKNNLDLSPTEVKLLVYFLENQNHVLTREQIFNQVWGDNCHYLDRTIDRHISSLRKKILDYGGALRTIYGAGYMWDTSVHDHYSASS